MSTVGSAIHICYLPVLLYLVPPVSHSVTSPTLHYAPNSPNPPQPTSQPPTSWFSASFWIEPRDWWEVWNYGYVSQEAERSDLQCAPGSNLPWPFLYLWCCVPVKETYGVDPDNPCSHFFRPTYMQAIYASAGVIYIVSQVPSFTLYSTNLLSIAYLPYCIYLLPTSLYFPRKLRTGIGKPYLGQICD